jgi:heme-degrading monooxygenase HmoA
VGDTGLRGPACRKDKDTVIVRAWHATATAEGADASREHFTRTALPDLQRIDGYQGAYLLRRDHDTHVQLQVLTLWDSLEAIRSFAGANLPPRRHWSSTTAPSPTTPSSSTRSAPTPAQAGESAVAELITEVGQSPLCLATTPR